MFCFLLEALFYIRTMCLMSEVWIFCEVPLTSVTQISKYLWKNKRQLRICDEHYCQNSDKSILQFLYEIHISSLLKIRFVDFDLHTTLICRILVRFSMERTVTIKWNKYYQCVTRDNTTAHVNNRRLKAIYYLYTQEYAYIDLTTPLGFE